MDHENILESFEKIQNQIDDLQAVVASTQEADMHILLPQVSKLVADLLAAYAFAKGKLIDRDDDLLTVFKSFVKGDASLNAVRDNVREIVYYQNCLAENRQDALPKNPAKMAVRTVQHVYFYLRSRLEQEHLLD